VVAEVVRNACPPGSISALELDTFEFDKQGNASVRTLTSTEIVEAGKQLERYQGECTACPGNVLGGSFGCFGKIRTPITGSGEQWLIRSLPADLTSPAGGMLPQVLLQLGCDGSDFRWYRGHSGLFFELAEPPTRSWQASHGLFTTSTDALYESMFLTGGNEGIQSFHGIMLCYLAGAFDDSSMPRFMQTQGESLPRGFRFDPKNVREPSVQDLQFFFQALYRAACLGDTLSVRVPRLQ
jgi:hypothetical protein